MRAGSLRLFAFGLLCVLAACGGQVAWKKAGTDDALIGNDLNGCRAAAQSSTQRMYGPLRIPTSTPGIFGGPSASEPTLADRQMREQEAVDRCMREKGYTLERVTP